ncbi:MAG TPA: hypothetical protein VKH35_02910 [Thermoanaerobaculia bacterium]|jgi:hypothetical protein|nr:hypothetical protein [Thermoanaerobaculia bacterium]
MRNGPRAAACLFVALFAMGASADLNTRPALPPVVIEKSIVPGSARLLPFRSLVSQVDTHVIANLLTDVPHPNDVPLSVVAGEPDHCEDSVCAVPLTIRMTETKGPVIVSFAVANSRGELSDVRHLECATGSCAVLLILERGRNTISVGVGDAIARTTAYTMVHVDADRTWARAGRTEWF